MFRMIIVEDEPWLRKGLEKMMQWEQYNINLVGTATNGSEVITLIDQYNPEIIITDIKMPIMDGLSMLDKLSEKIKPMPKVIIISGYDEFEYAKRALSHGVMDYILKPVDPEELKHAITKITNTLSVEKQELRNRKSLEIKSLLYDQVSGSLGRFDNDVFPEPFYYCLLLSNTASLNQIITSIMIQDIYFIPIMIGMYQLHIIGCSNKESLNNQIQTLLPHLQKEHVFGISSVNTKIGHSFFHAWKEAETSFQLQLRDKKECFEPFNVAISISKEDEVYILKALQNCDENLIHKVIDQVMNNYYHFEEKWIIQFQLYLFFCKYLTTDQLNSSNHIFKLHQFKFVYTMEDLNRFRDTVLTPLIRQIFDNVNPTTIDYILQVQNIIESRFSDSSLSLEEISQQLGLSTPYLSHLFKKETGTNFSAYLTRIRVERAKYIIINSNVPIYEVSNKVGFNDVKYFIKVFKRETGYSPNRYRGMNRTLICMGEK